MGGCELDQGVARKLNPIENQWGLILLHLRRRDTSTLLKVVKEIEDIWEHFEPSLLQKVTLSVPLSVKSCLKGKGHPTKY